MPADNPPPDGVALPAGLIDYDVHVVTPGDRADVKLFLPDGTQSAVYMLQSGQWKRFDNHATIDDTADQVTLRLADGGAGDQSGTDGVIHDPVGVAAPAPLGSFTVRNDTVPEGTGQTFAIKLQSCGTGTNPAGCVDIAGKSTTLGDAAFTFTGLTTTAGTWIRAVETVPSGWSVASVSCAGGSNQQTDPTNGNGSVKIVAGGTGGGECSFVNAQNGTVTLVKQTNPDGSPTSFPVHLRRCGSSNNNNACSGNGDPYVAPNNVSLTDNNHQTWTAANITSAGGFAGRFELTEDLPSGWTLGSVACTGGSGFSLKSQLTNGQRFYATSATPGIVCTFTNQGPLPGTITIKKNVAGGTDPTDFAFTATGVTPTTFSLDDDGDNTNALSNQTTFTDVPAGATYTFTETVPAGWLDPPSIACTGTNNETVQGAQLSVPVTSGADITCTFTNTKLTESTLTFHKRTLPAGTEHGVPVHVVVVHEQRYDAPHQLLGCGAGRVLLVRDR